MLFHRVGLVFFSGRAKSEAFAREADSFLRARGCKTVFPVAETDSGKLDLIITFGGDGTLLAGAGLAVKNNAPLLGVNLGTVGFLTEAEPSALEDVLTGIIDGKYQTEQRSLLHIKNEKTGEEFTALNDAVITRGGYARIIQINSFVDGKRLRLTSYSSTIIRHATITRNRYGLSLILLFCCPLIPDVIINPLGE